MKTPGIRVNDRGSQDNEEPHQIFSGDHDIMAEVPQCHISVRHGGQGFTHRITLFMSFCVFQGSIIAL